MQLKKLSYKLHSLLLSPTASVLSQIDQGQRSQDQYNTDQSGEHCKCLSIQVTNTRYYIIPLVATSTDQLITRTQLFSGTVLPHAMKPVGDDLKVTVAGGYSLSTSWSTFENKRRRILFQTTIPSVHQPVQQNFKVSLSVNKYTKIFPTMYYMHRGRNPLCEQLTIIFLEL